MKKPQMLGVCGVGLSLGLLTAVCLGSLAQGPGGPHKGWVDYAADQLSEVGRLKDRPGNYQALSAINAFLDGIYQVRPDYSCCAFPLQLDSRSHASWEALQKTLDDQARDGRKPRNKLRQFNVQIKSVSLHDPDEVMKNPALLKSPHRQDRLAEVRKRHPGRALLALVDAELQSLQSSKIEGGDPMILYLVHAKENWKVAWFDK